MNEKGRLGFILDFFHLWLSFVKWMTLNILSTFWWFLTLQARVPGLSDTWGACVWIGSVRWDHPHEIWFRRRELEELATHGGESGFWVWWSNDTLFIWGNSGSLWYCVLPQSLPCTLIGSGKVSGSVCEEGRKSAWHIKDPSNEAGAPRAKWRLISKALTHWGLKQCLNCGKCWAAVSPGPRQMVGYLGVINFFRVEKFPNHPKVLQWATIWHLLSVHLHSDSVIQKEFTPP